jgi:hypothetical protein
VVDLTPPIRGLALLVGAAATPEARHEQRRIMSVIGQRDQWTEIIGRLPPAQRVSTNQRQP